MTATAAQGSVGLRSRRVWFKIGLVLAGVMAVFNTINGVGTLVDPTFGQTDATVEPQPEWMSLALASFGLVTLVSLVPAWRRVRWAILAVVGSRLAEAWSAVVLPFLPDAPTGIASFVVVLVVVGTAVSAMVAQGLRPAA